MSTVVWPHRNSPLHAPFGRVPDVHASATLQAAVRDVRHPAGPSGANVTQDTLRIVMAGGGTGGHLYPGLAVAEALREQLGDRVELIWAATPRPVDQRLLTKFGPNYIQQPVQPLVKKIGKLWSFWTGWRQSCAYWRKTFTEKKVHAVLALGGYAAGPAAYVAKEFGIPLGLLNPDAVPGVANRFLAKRADAVFAQWELPANLSGHVHGRVLTVGCPIRDSLVGRTRAEGAERLGLDPLKKTLVITGASLGAKTINDAMVQLLNDAEIRAALAAEWQLLHLSGMDQAVAVRTAYEPVHDVPNKVLDYCDDMASVWAVADLAIARAGASTCAELTACGVPSILMPYPYHKDLHQRHNAEHLVKAGAALIVDDAKDAAQNAAALKPVLLDLFRHPARRDAMATGAKAAGKPNASRDIAAALIGMIGEVGK